MTECRFQSFVDASDPASAKPRLEALRKKLAAQNIDGFIVPRSDEHQNEYVPAGAERLAWLTGFTGSAGAAIVLANKAALFVDGRYTVQAREQVNPRLYEHCDLVAMAPTRWLAKNAAPDSHIGFDPMLHTPTQTAALRKAAAQAGACLVALDENPVDAIWPDRPAAPKAAVFLHPAKLAGEDAAKKIARVIKALKQKDGLFLSDPHAVAWLFNIRGADVAHTPLPLCWAYVPTDSRPIFYCDAEKLSPPVRMALEEVASISAPEKIPDDLRGLGAEKKHILFDAATAPEKFVALFGDAGGAPDMAADPVALMKACKNTRELRGMRAAHLRDGAALANFLGWIAMQSPRALTEISAAAALESFRRATGKLLEISFPTISAFGPHAALPHYRVTETSNLRFGKGLYLVDSGGQYADGTTDITRTIAMGKPSAEMRDRFTRVLKGHIAIATTVFPVGVSGAQIDSFARRYLWDAGLDFDHGVGHGVGAFLSVHEGPQRISKLGGVALEPGMVLSNEPGYYKIGEYGIRIENLLVVEKRKIPGAERNMLGFETISFAPIDLALIDKRMLTQSEIAWLNAYHATVRTQLMPKVDVETRAWLKQATRKLA